MTWYTWTKGYNYFRLLHTKSKCLFFNFFLHSAYKLIVGIMRTLQVFNIVVFFLWRIKVKHVHLLRYSYSSITAPFISFCYNLCYLLLLSLFLSANSKKWLRNWKDALLVTAPPTMEHSVLVGRSPLPYSAWIQILFSQHCTRTLQVFLQGIEN